MSGPLTGVRVVELAGIGPGPFAAMMLADMGADVVRVDRTVPTIGDVPGDLLRRGRRSVVIDLKQPDGLAIALRLIDSADALIEGYRPGVAERLGVGPEVCLDRNPGLVYGRVTGWGQEGPLAQAAGHDINYIALGGALAHIGRPGEPPAPPLNLVGDYGGGGMLLAFGIASALVERATSGRGQVVDAAIVDGTALLTAFFRSIPMVERGSNLLDGGAHFYDAYECADGRYVSVGAVEPQFYEELRSLLGLSDPKWDRSNGLRVSPELKQELAGIFRTRTRDEWCAVFDGTDACVMPVLTLDEAPEHPHNMARGTFVERDGVVQPAPGPRFSRTAPELGRPPSPPGLHTEEVLAELGLGPAEIATLRENGAIR